MPKSALTITKVKREFVDGTGLHETSLTINEGEFVSILGPSGCGKSTLLRCIAGLETPDQGDIFFGDQEVTHLPPNKRGLSMVFQDLALWPHMTVAGNIEFPLTVGKKVPAEQRKTKVQEAMRKVGIEDKAGQRPSQLSGGQQQRVAIARAIVSEPKLLLMDEPLSALDAALRIQIRGELTALAKQLGLTVIYVTHDQAEAMAMSDRVVVMNAGNVMQFDTPVTIYEHPADDFVAGFVGHTNVTPDGRNVRPEQVALAEPGQSGIDATIVTCQYVGGYYEVTCQVEGVDKPWMLYSHVRREPGDHLQLAI